MQTLQPNDPEDLVTYRVAFAQPLHTLSDLFLRQLAIDLRPPIPSPSSLITIIEVRLIGGFMPNLSHSGTNS